jgi:hypothetical protein
MFNPVVACPSVGTKNKDCTSAETSSFAADGYKQSIRTIKGLKDTFLGVNDKL